MKTDTKEALKIYAANVWSWHLEQRHHYDSMGSRTVSSINGVQATEYAWEKNEP